MKNIFLLSFLAVILVNGCKIKPKTPETPMQEKSLLLYVGTYTEEEGNASDRSKGIYVYRMNAGTGELTFINTSPFTVNPSFIDLSDDGRFLFAVNEIGGDTTDGFVSSFSLGDHEKPEFISQVSSEGDYPCYIEASGNGKYILVANYGSGTVAGIPVQSDGSLVKATFVDQHKGKGTTARQESPHAHCIVISPEGKFAYSNDLGTDRIYIYRLTETNPVLSGTYQSANGAGPRHLAFHPFRNFVYSINELNGTIDCLRRDTISGDLVHVQTISTLGDHPGPDPGSADIHIAPSGKYLYATNRGDFNNIASFRINMETGELTLTGIQTVKGKTPRNFAIDPSGNFLLVANQNSDQIVTFRIDPETGLLIDEGIQTQVPAPVCIKFLPEHLN